MKLQILTWLQKTMVPKESPADQPAASLAEREVCFEIPDQRNKTR